MKRKFVLGRFLIDFRQTSYVNDRRRSCAHLENDLISAWLNRLALVLRALNVGWARSHLGSATAHKQTKAISTKKTQNEKNVFFSFLVVGSWGGASRGITLSPGLFVTSLSGIDVCWVCREFALTLLRSSLFRLTALGARSRCGPSAMATRLCSWAAHGR